MKVQGLQDEAMAALVHDQIKFKLATDDDRADTAYLERVVHDCEQFAGLSSARSLRL